MLNLIKKHANAKISGNLDRFEVNSFVCDIREIMEKSVSIVADKSIVEDLYGTSVSYKTLPDFPEHPKEKGFFRLVEGIDIYQLDLNEKIAIVVDAEYDEKLALMLHENKNIDESFLKKISYGLYIVD